MKIDSSTVGMESARSYRASNTTFRRFTIMDYQQGLNRGSNALNTAVGGNTGNTGGTGDTEGKNQTSQKTTVTTQDWQVRFQASSSRVTIRSSASQTFAEMRQMTFRYIFDMLFGSRRNRLGSWAQINGWSNTSSYTSSSAWTTQETGFFQNGELGTGSAQGGNNIQGNGAQNTAGTQGTNGGQNSAASFMGLQLLGAGQAGIQIEAEDTAFTTKGTVRTSDGREISFNVNVGMSRRFQQYYQEEFQQASVDLCDPLVINLDTDVAELSDQTFYFDIDGDGELDEISQLGAGSGYLALDKNGDGTINDGNELFGTSSGNGFADLAKYDEDGNGWIDENDAIWDKLKIWCKDENGNDVLYRLADKGVGAICLQNVATDFALKGQEGQTKGAIRNTGVFLYENGNVGTVQHVDVAKYDKGA